MRHSIRDTQDTLSREVTGQLILEGRIFDAFQLFLSYEDLSDPYIFIGNIRLQKRALKNFFRRFTRNRLSYNRICISSQQESLEVTYDTLKTQAKDCLIRVL